MELTPGSRLDHFEILNQLGEGGMGTVFRAHDTELDRDVALKVLREEVSTDPTRLDRFKREARVASARKPTGAGQVMNITEKNQPA